MRQIPAIIDDLDVVARACYTLWLSTSRLPLCRYVSRTSVTMRQPSGQQCMPVSSLYCMVSFQPLFVGYGYFGSELELRAGNDLLLDGLIDARCARVV